MTDVTLRPRTALARLRLAALLAMAGLLLAACETTTTKGPAAEAAKPPEPPLTRTDAARECWMKTEKGSASLNIDKRADLVDKCIDDKMKAAPPPPPPKT